MSKSCQTRWLGAAVGFLATPLLVWANGDANHLCIARIFDEHGNAVQESQKMCASNEGCARRTGVSGGMEWVEAVCVRKTK